MSAQAQFDRESLATRADAADLARPLRPARAKQPPAAQEPSEEQKRLLQLAPLIDFAAGRSVRVWHARARSLWEVAQYVGQQNGMSARTLLRHYRNYLERGITALCPKPYKNRGESKLFGRVPQTIPDDAPDDFLKVLLTPAGEFIAGLRLRDNYNFQDIAEAVNERSADFGLSRPVAYNTVRNWLNQWPQSVRDFATLRLQQWNDRHRPSVRRDYSTVAVMEWWNLDYAQDDFFVYNDFLQQWGSYTFPDFQPNKWLRMWWIFVQDVRSRFMLGYRPSAFLGSTGICLAFRDSVLRTGSAPRVVLTDRGKDFLKTVAKDQAQRIEGALLRVIHHFHGEQGRAVISIGRNPQSKPIESPFRLKRERFDRKVYSRCGNAPQNRPDSTQTLLDAHEAWAKAGALGVSPALPRASEAIAGTVQWIEGWYNAKHRHSGDGMNRCTPEQVFRAGWPLERENAAKRRLDPRVLEELLWERKLCAVRDCRVQIAGAVYVPADAESEAALRAWNGGEQKVLVAYDPFQREAVAYNSEGQQRLGALIAEHRFAWGEPQENIREHLRTRGRHRRAVKGIVDQLPQLTSAERPFGLLGAAEGPAVASSPRVLRKRAEDAARELPASPFVDDAVRDFLESDEGKDFLGSEGRD